MFFFINETFEMYTIWKKLLPLPEVPAFCKNI